MHIERRLALSIFLVLLFCYAYFFPRWADWNQNSRLNLTLALVEQGTIRIDDYYENTGDYAVYNGHIYTDKAPGSSFLGAPVYFVFRWVAQTPPVQTLLDRMSSSDALAATLREDGTGLLTQKVYRAAALYAVTFVTVSLPSALLGALLFLFLGRWLPSPSLRVGVVLAYGLATVVFPYSTVFYGHQTATALLFASFYLLFRIRWDGWSDNWLWLVGAFLGLAVFVEFPALLPLLVLAGYALWTLRTKWHIVKLGLGGLPFALLLGWYNNTAFGSPFSSSYRYLGVFSEISNTGFLGFSQPSWEAVWGVTFSPYRGLFFLSPFLLLAVLGFWYLFRVRQWRAESVLCLAMMLVQLGLISAWYDWRGGFAIGPRNLLTMLPYLMIPLAALIEKWRISNVRMALVWSMVLLSFGLVWVASVSGQDFAPIVIANPLTQFFWPKFLAGDITRNLGMVVGLSSWASLIPLFLLLGGLIWLTQGRGNRLQRQR